ncbi:MAG: hypothetical protein NWT08_13290 [Akkermansiaceae bacterium]|jgi:hypothetical protein|nr:hypothetical protein [Akkermansiaceae bacterium]MDP4647675.1 hypothetical protein [Akkermansiaceae bacterium]MDP4722266.1 hypothetical protein [Akkermansiaceae bacterium]MDP4780306.1 hypothetical protein [Akkermansiaceae bacterium]MDP4846210.1 hypothetical protein [Akkermansiaceae bacterium]
MKTLVILVLSIAANCYSFAGDAPRGFMELSELEEAKAEALEKGKLLAIVAKGNDDACPRCAAALENGTKAIKTDCVLVFARVSEVRENKELPAAVLAETKDAISGAWVTFYVFDAGLEKLVAEADRKQLESDKDATKEFKKKVDAARKELTGK